MKLTRSQMLLMGSCMLGLASVMLQACSEKEDTRTAMCGNWESVAGKPDMLIFKEGEAYKVTLFRRKGISRKLTPETYLLQQEDNGNLFINTGFRIDVAYNEATDVITFSPNGDYVRARTEQ